MDELAEDTFENVTTYEKPAFLYVFDGITVAVCLLGMAADILIVYTMTSSRYFRSRTHSILKNWAITDALFLFSKTAFLSDTVGALYVDNIAFCVVRHAHDTYEVASTVFIVVLVLDQVVKTKRLATSTILLLVYVGSIGFGMLQIVVCSYFHFLSILASLAIFAGLTLTVLTKEVIGYRRGSPSGSGLLRLNVARIYVYSWLICFSFRLPFFIDLPEGLVLLLLLLFLLGYLIPVYVLVYLYHADKVFKICVLNVFRREEDRYNVDDTVGFEDLSEEEVEEPRVNGTRANKEVNA